MTFQTFTQALIIGLLLGGVYSIIAAGASLYFGVMRIVNFAHGECLTLSMFICYYLVTLLGLDMYVSMLLCAVIMFAIGYFFQKGIQNKIFQKEKERAPGSLLLFSLGVGMIIKNGCQIFFGTTPKMVSTQYSGGTFDVGSIIVSTPRAMAMVISVISIVLLTLFLQKTETGRALRAVSQNRSVAPLMGIDQSRMFCLAFGIGIGLIGIAGGAMLPFMTLSPSAGSPYGFKAFVIIVLGGMGSIAGALVAGLLIGVIESVGSLVMSPAYANSLGFILFVILLLVKPSGLFGKERS